MKNGYELTFVGGAMARYFPKYQREHDTLESAQKEAARVCDDLDGRVVAAHQPIIYRIVDGQVAGEVQKIS